MTLNSLTLSYEAKINIIDDNLIEPYEFFTLDLYTNETLVFFSHKQVFVYIEDNDCKCFIILLKKIFFSILIFKKTIQEKNRTYTIYSILRKQETK